MESIIESDKLKEQQEINTLWQEITNGIKGLRADADTDQLAVLNELVNKIEKPLTETLDRDSLSNLCLLDNVTNIQVGKKIFRKKRDLILELTKPLNDGGYVPIASKQVFQKSLTASDNVSFNYWNTKDRSAYLEDIKNKINAFLKLSC